VGGANIGSIGMSALRVLGTVTEMQMRARVQSPAALGTWLATRLSDLGTTYIKAGQFMSARHDIFGAEFCTPLESLRDRVQPMPASVARAVLAQHPAIAGALQDIDWDAPIASASIGQVHRARLEDGRFVVVKLRRPGVEAMIDRDIQLMDMLVQARTTLETWLPGLLPSNSASRVTLDQTRQSLSDFRAYLMRELDFVHEAKVMTQFRAMYQGASASAQQNPIASLMTLRDDRSRRRRTRDGSARQSSGDGNSVVVPRVHMHLCTPDVLVMDYVPSRDITTVAATASPAVARRLANRVMEVFITQLTQHGLVHGDPHPGNMGIDRRGRLVLYDFGSSVRVTHDERYAMKALIWQLVLSDGAGAVESLRDLGADIHDEKGVKTLLVLYRRYMRTVDVGIIRDDYDPSTPLPLRLPDKVMRLSRVYGMLEGTCKRIYPGFNYVELLTDTVDTLVLDEEFLARRASEDVSKFLGNLFAPRF
jgi:predicted unusual protein kinase regulating ubiquinone biosynthesis (AarF/ABC1/UbiB family)